MERIDFRFTWTIFPPCCPPRKPLLNDHADRPSRAHNLLLLLKSAKLNTSTQRTPAQRPYTFSACPIPSVTDGVQPGSTCGVRASTPSWWMVWNMSDPHLTLYSPGNQGYPYFLCQPVDTSTNIVSNVNRKASWTGHPISSICWLFVGGIDKMALLLQKKKKKKKRKKEKKRKDGT